MISDLLPMLREVDSVEERYSRGFLRCRLEKLMAKLGLQWLPLFHSLGIECTPVSFVPTLEMPAKFDYSFGAQFAENLLFVGADLLNARTLAELILPKAEEPTMGIILEYVARRFFVTSAIALGAEPIIFDSKRRYDPEVGIAGVRCAVNLAGKDVVFWVSLDSHFLNRLDTLWISQWRARVNSDRSRTVSVELPITESFDLPSFDENGRCVLSNPLNFDSALFFAENRAWMSGEVVSVNGRLGFQVLAGPAPGKPPSVALQLGNIELSATEFVEMSQVGAIKSFNSGDIMLLVNRVPYAAVSIQNLGSSVVIERLS